MRLSIQEHVTSSRPHSPSSAHVTSTALPKATSPLSSSVSLSPPFAFSPPSGLRRGGSMSEPAPVEEVMSVPVAEAGVLSSAALTSAAANITMWRALRTLCIISPRQQQRARPSRAVHEHSYLWGNLYIPVFYLGSCWPAAGQQRWAVGPPARLSLSRSQRPHSPTRLPPV